MYFIDGGQQDVSWGVVCTCHEPTVLLLAFVSHHLALGASYVELFLDRPDPQVEAALQRLPGCRVTLCDDAYWQEDIGGPRPPATEKRQIRNAIRAYARAEVDWLLHLDADEFLEVDLPLSALLGALPDQVDFLALPNLERVFDRDRPQLQLFDGYMRAPLARGWPNQSQVLSADVQPYLHNGLTGHSQGKSVVRTGRSLWQGIHSPRAKDPKEQPRLISWPATRARILHFDGLTGLHFIAKLTRGWSDQPEAKGAHAQLSQARLAQIRQVQESGRDMVALVALHQQLKSLPVVDLERLDLLGLLATPRINPGAAMRGYGIEVDLSVRSFDQALALDLPNADRFRARWQRRYRQFFEPEPEAILAE
ncbi:glycosyltransferase family 2 protein [Phaeobacter sp. HF9A]|uniref:glycosyltransferase family 2 protein n=1 Tax=Phaeobacter sp. HF9A TaxID=2721561 RepID=UPI00142F440C|nr:glycosyltransferase family 2 protein [Phaeobacter sp. HF9A]NIZ12894.1 glycosyltransferase family 2 protein [Phaeobacter sp. HF9A]